MITEEAVRRLPPPLRDLLGDETNLKRLADASLDPDRRVERLKDSPEYKKERTKHYFDIDGITDEPPPFAKFPRDRKAAEKEFGADKFAEFGAAPWVAVDAQKALAGALSRGATADIFTAAGDLAHFAADLHQPLHVTKNFNGDVTGNKGIHKILEIGLVNRYAGFYAADIRRGRADVVYVEDVEGRLFDWLIAANARVKDICDADIAARKKTGYQPPEKREDYDKELDDANSARAKPYYAALKAELEARGSPEAAAMRDAAGHLAQLIYTAWVQAGKPISLSPASAAEPPPAATSHYWLVLPMALLLFIILWPRRKPAA
jgi:hypothetical protein